MLLLRWLWNFHHNGVRYGCCERLLQQVLAGQTADFGAFYMNFFFAELSLSGSLWGPPAMVQMAIFFYSPLPDCGIGVVVKDFDQIMGVSCISCSHRACSEKFHERMRNKAKGCVSTSGATPGKMSFIKTLQRQT